MGKETKTTEIQTDEPQVERVIFDALSAEYAALNVPATTFADMVSSYGYVDHDSINNYFQGKTNGLETSISLFMLTLDMAVYDVWNEQWIDHTKIDVTHLQEVGGKIRNQDAVPNINNRILFKSIYGVFKSRQKEDGTPWNFGELVRRCKVVFPKTSFGSVQRFVEGKANARETLLNIIMLALGLRIGKQHKPERS